MSFALTGTASSATYVAAFVEHTATSPCGSGSCGPATRKTNVAALVAHAAMASTRGAEIVIFGEYAITGFSSYPKEAWISGGYSEVIPSPPVAGAPRVVPCDAAGGGAFADATSVVALSCAAREHKVAIVANLVDHVRATGKVFNTDVAFDTDGAYLAKYHKQNLWGEANMDVPLDCPHASFTTSFNVTFGLLTCADLIYAKPAAALLGEGIRNFLVPLAWSNEMAQMQVLGWAQAFSLRHAVNLVVANHRTSSESGSGAWSSGTALKYVYSPGERDGPVYTVSFDAATAAEPLPLEASAAASATAAAVPAIVSTATTGKGGHWAFARFDAQSGVARVCAGAPSTLCCDASSGSGGAAHVLAALDGFDSDDGVSWGAQICAVLACPVGESGERCLTYRAGAPATALPAVTLSASGLSLGAGGAMFAEALATSRSTTQIMLPPLSRAPVAGDADGGLYFVDAGSNATLVVRAPNGADAGLGLGSAALYGRVFARDKLPYSC